MFKACGGRQWMVRLLSQASESHESVQLRIGLYDIFALGELDLKTIRFQNLKSCSAYPSVYFMVI